VSERDMRPALGSHGPARWRRARKGAKVALHGDRWQDGAWSFLFKADTDYAAHAPAEDAHRIPEMPDQVQRGMMKPPVWTWEVPLYFWFGGMAAGSSFVALACDLVGDRRSARWARLVSLAAVLPCPPLLIADLGRPLRFLNMMRIFKPRSPMSMGAWCLVGFSSAAAAAVAADVAGMDKTARRVGGANAVLGGYLGSYTGVLLASTAVPLWARSKYFLGPIFVMTGVATGAATCRLTLVHLAKLPTGHPTREALARVETGAIAGELILSQINDVRLGRLAHALEHGRPGRWFAAAKWLVRAGLTLRFATRGRTGSRTHHVASACYMAAALCFRYAWVEGGRVSARDDEAVARTARARATAAEPDATLQVTHH
jgi:formate-dependent nitrite reductase membrane component NrfD